jgi:hypothetical protein
MGNVATNSAELMVPWVMLITVAYLRDFCCFRDQALTRTTRKVWLSSVMRIVVSTAAGMLLMCTAAQVARALDPTFHSAEFLATAIVVDMFGTVFLEVFGICAAVRSNVLNNNDDESMQTSSLWRTAFTMVFSLFARSFTCLVVFLLHATDNVVVLPSDIPTCELCMVVVLPTAYACSRYLLLSRSLMYKPASYAIVTRTVQLPSRVDAGSFTIEDSGSDGDQKQRLSVNVERISPTTEHDAINKSHSTATA